MDWQLVMTFEESAWNYFGRILLPRRVGHDGEVADGGLLRELRKVEALSQTELARRMGVSQPAIARIEAQDDVQVSTLQRLVEALGGSLEVIARLPSGTYRVGQFTAASH